jgi:hypothetical protein
MTAKSRITRLFKFGVWKVTNPNRPYPMYLFGFREACNVAKLMAEGA